MNRTLLTTASLIAAIAFPAAAIASPNSTDKHKAKTSCHSQRGSSSASREAFDRKFGAAGDDSRATGRCVAKVSRQMEAERHAAELEAEHATPEPEPNDAPGTEAEPNDTPGAQAEANHAPNHA